MTTPTCFSSICPDSTRSAARATWSSSAPSSTASRSTSRTRPADMVRSAASSSTPSCSARRSGGSTCPASGQRTCCTRCCATYATGLHHDRRQDEHAAERLKHAEAVAEQDDREDDRDDRLPRAQERGASGADARQTSEKRRDGDHRRDESERKHDQPTALLEAGSFSSPWPSAMAEKAIPAPDMMTALAPTAGTRFMTFSLNRMYAV